MKPLDLPQRIRIALKFLEKLQILFSDEARIWLNGYGNKQNCHIWNRERIEEIQELLLHPEKITVWCDLWAGGIIVPYLFKNHADEHVAVNDTP